MKRCLPLLLLGALSLLTASCSRSDWPVQAGDENVHLMLSTNRLQVGDILHARIDVRHPAGARVDIPSLDSEAFTVNERDWENLADPEETPGSRYTYVIQVFEPGEFRLSTNAIVIRAEGEEQTLDLPDLTFEVVSSLETGEDLLQDVKAPLLWPDSTRKRLLPAFLLILALALAAGLTAWFMRRKKTQEPIEPPIPAHEKALRALRALRSQGDLEAGRYEPFYVGLSTVVRTYLEDRFRLRAPEQTTEEFIREASRNPALTQAQQGQVCGFLEQSDLVKFARFQPSYSEAEQALTAAEALVRQTAEGGAP